MPAGGGGVEESAITPLLLACCARLMYVCTSLVSNRRKG